MVEKLVNLTGNKSTSYAWTCLLNCTMHANDVIMQRLMSLCNDYGIYF